MGGCTILAHATVMSARYRPVCNTGHKAHWWRVVVTLRQGQSAVQVRRISTPGCSSRLTLVVPVVLGTIALGLLLPSRQPLGGQRSVARPVKVML